MKPNSLAIKIVQLIFILVLASCGKEEVQKPDSRKITVYCDESIYPIIFPCVQHYDTIGSLVKLTFRKTSAWDAMAKLLSREADAIVIARSYTRYEDSLMKAFNVSPHTRLTLARDALVFYVNKDSPLDTLTDEQIRNFLTDRKYSLKKIYPKLVAEPIFVSNGILSSELVNLNNLVLKNRNLTRPLKIFNSHDSVKNFVKANSNSIGIGYLSHLFAEPDLRALPISFIDSANRYIFPHNVNQPNILRANYPYIVEHYIFVLDKLNDNSMTFARYLFKPGFPQKFFFERGIVPSNAEFRLIEDE
ncbi:MAG: substrate-binding domain-containing protein [Ignavibacteria bacterium]|nr:substrate-binding domain-containing protein [Ignavibacteria bacterium]